MCSGGRPTGTCWEPGWANGGSWASMGGPGQGGRGAGRCGTPVSADPPGIFPVSCGYTGDSQPQVSVSAEGGARHRALLADVPGRPGGAGGKGEGRTPAARTDPVLPTKPVPFRARSPLGADSLEGPGVREPGRRPSSLGAGSAAPGGKLGRPSCPCAQRCWEINRKLIAPAPRSLSPPAAAHMRPHWSLGHCRGLGLSSPRAAEAKCWAVRGPRRVPGGPADPATPTT